MKLTKVLVVAVVCLTIVSCNNNGFKAKSSLGSDIDSVSYALGLDMATKIKANFDEMDQDLFIQGYKNGMDSTSLLIEAKEVNVVLRNYFQKKQQEKMKKMQAEQQEKALVEFADYKKENEQYLVNNKTKEGVKLTESGLQYVVVKAGAGESPTASQRVKVLYKGMLTDGTVFDSNENRDKPSEFGITQVIKGWTEGLQLMKPGAKYKFFIPQELAYGSQQRGKEIKPFSTLVFEVELIQVVK